MRLFTHPREKVPTGTGNSLARPSLLPRTRQGSSTSLPLTGPGTDTGTSGFAAGSEFTGASFES
jgi:hypothetical protein